MIQFFEHLAGSNKNALHLEGLHENFQRIQAITLHQDSDHRNRAPDTRGNGGARQRSGAADFDDMINPRATCQPQELRIPVGRRPVIDSFIRTY